MYKKHYAYGTNIHTFTFDPELYFWTIEVGKDRQLETLSQLAKGADYCINWSVFDWSTGQNGYGRIQNGDNITQGSSVGFPTVSFADGILVEKELPIAYPGFPRWRRLIENGIAKVSYSVPGNQNFKDARSAIGQLKNGQIVFVTVEGDDTKKKGTTCLELGQFMVSLGCVYACDSDGGGSAAAYTKDGYKYNQGRAIAGAMVLRKKTFVDLVKSKVGCGYALGSQGEILTPESLEKLIKWAGGKRSLYISEDKDVRIWYGKQVFDCSGLVVWALQRLGLVTQDYFAHDLYNKLCVPVDKPDIGDLCFRKDLSHVGIYIGNNQYLHARGTMYGVVITGQLDFTLFGRLNLGGDKMDKWATTALEFVRKFQSKFGLEVDGKAGPATQAKLNEITGSKEGLEIKDAWKKFKEAVE